MKQVQHDLVPFSVALKCKTLFSSNLHKEEILSFFRQRRCHKRPSSVFALETTKPDTSLDTRLIINLTLSLLVSAPENQSLLNASGGDRLCLTYVATLGDVIDIC